MKKLLVIAGLCLVLIAMPMTIASPQVGIQHTNQLLTTTQQTNHMLRHHNPSPTNGTFTGIFAMKNESGYVPLGTLEGTFSDYGFEGTWALDNGTASGTFNGYTLWGPICWGYLNTDGSNESQYFGGLFRVNETDNSFQAVSIVLGYNGYAIRYAIGDIE
jgi:hypothetical protein